MRALRLKTEARISSDATIAANQYMSRAEETTTMTTDAENQKLLRETRDAVIEMKTRIDIYLGKDGVVDQLQTRVDGIHSRMLLFMGGGIAVLFIAEKAWAYFVK